LLEVLGGHENSITSIAQVNGQLFSGSKDFNIICWDLGEIEERILAKNEFKASDLYAMRYDGYLELVNKRGRKPKLPALKRANR
jgi:hypothetical protein